MITILHAADFHLDSPFAGLPPEKAAQRRGEQRQLLQRIAELADSRSADLILLPGDLLDGRRVFRETTELLARTLGRLRARVFIAPGNHDYYSSRSPYAAIQWPENVHIFQSSAIESVDLPDLNCVVHGAAFTAPYQDGSLLSGFQATRDGKLHLMVLHGDVGGNGRYGSILPEEIAESGLHYLALGHIHACSGVQRTGDTFWAYAGCPEGRGFDETGEKGVLCGTVDDTAARLDFVPTAQHRYAVLHVDISAGETPAAALAAAVPNGREQDICRIILTGESGVTGLDLNDLEPLVRDKFYSVTLYDRTRVQRDLWARRGEDTLTGLFLRELDSRLNSGGEEVQIQRAVRFGLAALENGEDVCP